MPKSSRKVFALRAAYIEFLHDEAVSLLWPGSEPVSPREYRDSALLESAVNRPFHTAFGKEMYPHLEQKAAALFHSLIANHPFHNGNKRTAVIALGVFLLANGLFLTISDGDIYDLAKNTATYRQAGKTHEEAFQEIVTAIREHVVRLRLLRTRWPSLYRSCVSVRRFILRNPANHPQRA